MNLHTLLVVFSELQYQVLPGWLHNTSLLKFLGWKRGRDRSDPVYRFFAVARLAASEGTPLLKAIAMPLSTGAQEVLV